MTAGSAKTAADAAARARLDPLLLLPGHELGRMIREGSLSAARLCQVYVARIELVQPQINCMAEARFAEALEEARQIDALVARYRAAQAGGERAEFSALELQRLRSPLLGVPVSIKESVQVRGMINSCGAWARRRVRAERDALVVARLRQAGLVPVCTSVVPEMTLYWADCHNLVHGRARNPYDQARVTGASSGGEGGLIAAACLPLGLGSDIGGSLRSPAHYCGIFAHKPSPHLVPAAGNWPPVREARLRLFTLGPMCRYATDLRHLLRMMLSELAEGDAQAEAAALASSLSEPQLNRSEKGKGDNHKTSETKTKPPPTTTTTSTLTSTQPPADIGERRARLLELLDEPAWKAVDFSRIKLVFCGNYKRQNRLLALLGEREPGVQREICQAQQEVLDHFVAKFGCRVERIELDSKLRDMFKIWHAMLRCGATQDREQAFEEDEAERLFQVKHVGWELLKWLAGASRHTKEALLTLAVGMPMPRRRRQAYAHCEKFERLGEELRNEINQKLGDTGVLVTPTLPTVAHRHHFALLRKNETRFPCLLNVLQLPATHATVRLSERHQLPYGLTLASRPFNDHLTLAMAEEIEATFGGWRLPTRLEAKLAPTPPAKSAPNKARVAPQREAGNEPASLQAGADKALA